MNWSKSWWYTFGLNSFYHRIGHILIWTPGNCHHSCILTGGNGHHYLLYCQYKDQPSSKVHNICLNAKAVVIVILTQKQYYAVEKHYNFSYMLLNLSG